MQLRNCLTTANVCLCEQCCCSSLCFHYTFTFAVVQIFELNVDELATKEAAAASKQRGKEAVTGGAAAAGKASGNGTAAAASGSAATPAPAAAGKEKKEESKSDKPAAEKKEKKEKAPKEAKVMVRPVARRAMSLAACAITPVPTTCHGKCLYAALLHCSLPPQPLLP